MGHLSLVHQPHHLVLKLVGLTSNPNPSLDFTLDFTPFESDDEKSIKNAKCCKIN